MKTLRSLALFSLPLLCVAALAASPSAKVDDKSDFRQGFEQAMSINSKQEMQRLLRDYDVQSVLWILETAETIAASPNDKVFERMNHLREAWKKVHQTDFCDKMEKYYSLLLGPNKRERMRIKGEYDTMVVNYFNNLEKKEQSAFGVLAGEFIGLANAFAEVGDTYYSSQSWSFVGHCVDEPNRKADADLKQACAAFGKCIKTREDIGLKDRLYKTTKPHWERLIALGYGPEPVGGGEGGEGGMAVEAAASVTATMAFERIDKLDRYQRPNYFLDDHYSIWNSIILAAKGSQGDIPRLADGPKALRTGASKVFVDLDLDGEGDIEIPLRGAPQPIEFEIGEGEAKRKWAFLALVGHEQDQYQGVQMNLSPQDASISIYTIPAGSMIGQIGDTPVRVIDENMNGEYGDFFQSAGWGHVGLTDDNFQPEVDSILIGDAKKALPWSEYQVIGDQWYKLEVKDAGVGIIATPVTVPTGSLKLKFKGPKPSYVIVKGSNKYENCYFDISSGKAVDVPIGRYELYFGLVAKGKKKQSVKACMLPGLNTPKWSVAAGETAEVVLGAPFSMDAQFEVDGNQLIVTGTSVVITGSGNERYERPYQCRPQPEVSWRKKGSKRGSKGDKMKLLGSSTEVENHGYRQAWFPYDLEIKLKGAPEDVEIQLLDKKNKLFGKVESDWIE